MDRFYIKDELDLKIEELPKIKSEDQLANIFTKVVSYRSYSKLGMCGIYTNLKASIEFFRKFSKHGSFHIICDYFFLFLSSV